MSSTTTLRRPNPASPSGLNNKTLRPAATTRLKSSRRCGRGRWSSGSGMSPPVRSSGAPIELMSCSILPRREAPRTRALLDLRRHPRQPGGFPGRAQVYPEKENRPLHLPRRYGRLWSFAQRDHPEDPDTETPVHDPRKPRQGRLRPGLHRDVQPHRRLGYFLDQRENSEEELQLPPPPEAG